MFRHSIIHNGLKNRKTKFIKSYTKRDLSVSPADANHTGKKLIDPC